MFGQCLLLATGISGISTGIYSTFTSNKYDNRKIEKMNILVFLV